MPQTSRRGIGSAFLDFIGQLVDSAIFSNGDGAVLSAIICTYNPDLKRLDRVLRALEAQTLPQSEWECLLIDNASVPALAGQVDMAWHASGRIVREEAVGLTHARLKSIAEARGEILVFVDDDCLLDPDYLAQTVKIHQKNFFLGAVGGYGRAEYATTPPPWLTKSLRQYHLDMPIPQTEHTLAYARVRKFWGPWFPVGAGLTIRRELAMRYADLIRNDPLALGLGRSGNILTGGEDLDMDICVMDQGYAIGKSTELRFTHVIPNSRLELDYMLQLLYLSQYSTERLLVHRGWKKALPWKPPSAWQKIKRRITSLRRYPAEDRCWQALARGKIDGLSGAPPDPRYCKR